MSQHRDELRALRERFRAVADVDRDALPSLWAAVLLRMRDECMIRGHGSVPGELAESLVARFYGGTLSPPSTADFDVLTPTGRKIQVKALRYSQPGRSSVGSFTRPVAFDELAVVRFEYDMRVRDALLLDAHLLRVSTEHDAGLLTPAGMRLTITRKVLDAADVISAERLWTVRAGDPRDRAL